MQQISHFLDPAKPSFRAAQGSPEHGSERFAAAEEEEPRTNFYPLGRYLIKSTLGSSPSLTALLIIALNSAGRRSLSMMVWRQSHITAAQHHQPSP